MKDCHETQGLPFRFFGFQIPDSGFRIPESDSGVRTPDSGFRIPDSEFRSPDSGFRIPDSGCVIETGYWRRIPAGYCIDRWIHTGHGHIMDTGDGSRKKLGKMFKIWRSQILNIFPSLFLDSSPYPLCIHVHYGSICRSSIEQVSFSSILSRLRIHL